MTDDSRAREFEQVMTRLRNNYLASLPGKADELTRALTAANSGDDSAGREVAQLIHRLAGTAGSFGMHQVSNRANDLDSRFHAGASHRELHDEIEQFVAFLRAIDK